MSKLPSVDHAPGAARLSGAATLPSTTRLPSVEGLLEKLQHELGDLLHTRGWQQAVMVGIHTGGAWVAEQLHKRLGLAQPLSRIDISFYRDDFSRKGLHPKVKASQLRFAVEDAQIVLVDDVIMSGRTIRAAMNEIFDYGRPAGILLASLVSLPGRELPIQPDVFGIQMDLQPNQRVKLHGPEPLSLELIQV